MLRSDQHDRSTVDDILHHKQQFDDHDDGCPTNHNDLESDHLQHNHGRSADFDQHLEHDDFRPEHHDDRRPHNQQYDEHYNNTGIDDSGTHNIYHDPRPDDVNHDHSATFVHYLDDCPTAHVVDNQLHQFDDILANDDFHLDLNVHDESPDHFQLDNHRCSEHIHNQHDDLFLQHDIHNAEPDNEFIINVVNQLDYIHELYIHHDNSGSHDQFDHVDDEHNHSRSDHDSSAGNHDHSVEPATDDNAATNNHDRWRPVIHIIHDLFFVHHLNDLNDIDHFNVDHHKHDDVQHNHHRRTRHLDDRSPATVSVVVSGN